MKDGRWVALPVTLTALTVVLCAIRIRIVRQRTGDWSGEDCVVGPYNPAERDYLYAITALLVVSITTTVLTIIRTDSSASTLIAIALSLVCLVIALYALYVWGGLEYNNQPHPEDPCSFRLGVI